METDTSATSGASSNLTNALGTRLSVAEKIGFGLGDTASNILYQAWSFFLAKFYTDVFGLPTKHAATLFLVTRIWDVIFDPTIGMIADRTNTRWGKFRPYLLWMAVPYGVLACAMFITPNWGLTPKIIYAYATYMLATMAYTAVNIPYSSLMAVITPDPKERTTLSQYRFFFAFVGMLLITTFTLPLAKYFGSNPSHPGYSKELGYSQALGYQMTMAVFGGIAIVLLLITFLTTRERVQPPKHQKSTFAQDLGDVSRNLPWIILFLACVFWLIHNMIRNGTVVYFFDYVSTHGKDVLFSIVLSGNGSAILVGNEAREQFLSNRPNFHGFLLDFDMTTTFLTVGTFGMMAGVLLSTFLKKCFGKKPVAIFLALATVVVEAAFYVLPPTNFALLCRANFVWSILAGATPVFLFAMFADVTDFHEWKFSRRATGLVIAGVMIAIKLGVALGGYLNLKFLDHFGYVANAVQTPEVVRGIKLMFSVIPAAFMLVSAIVLCVYPVSEKLMTTIELDLKERKSKEQ